VSGVEDWWAGGERVELELGGQRRGIFVRRLGEGPHLTAIHGFPSSSHDWERASGLLAPQRELLLFDLLGFGASDKPADHAYTMHEQADLVEALWRRDGVRETTLLGHDYGVSVVQELLARAAEGRLATRIAGVHLLNGALYPDLHRPQPAQTALLDPEQGPKLSELLNEELFVASLKPTFAPGHDAAGDGAEIWRATARDGGSRIAHLLIAYIPDRERHRDRWVGALEATDVPTSFVWGMLDPVSGAHMAARVRERLPDAAFVELPHVAHWPPLEAPEQVADAVLAAA
jgi:pimeloyl-ACP methyl ester carboxylesterase